MNQAAIKYANISAAQKGKIIDSEKTITKDIFIMITDSNCCQRTPSQSNQKYHTPPNNQTNDNS